MPVYLVVECEVDAALSDADTARLSVDDGVVDVCEDSVRCHHIDVTVTVLIPRRTHRVSQVWLRLVVQQLYTAQQATAVYNRQPFSTQKTDFLETQVHHQLCNFPVV